MGFFKRLPLRIAHEVIDKTMNFLSSEGRMFQLLQVTIDSKHRRLACAQVAIRCPFLNAKGQKLCDIHKNDLLRVT